MTLKTLSVLTLLLQWEIIDYALRFIDCGFIFQTKQSSLPSGKRCGYELSCTEGRNSGRWLYHQGNTFPRSPCLTFRVLNNILIFHSVDTLFMPPFKEVWIHLYWLFFRLMEWILEIWQRDRLLPLPAPNACWSVSGDWYKMMVSVNIFVRL